ncbi:conserved hypothetical protein [uncultured Pleomorphomonas sp.]|uniref:Calcineurin-like phosphoesterase domain-containing protein n=1 Tax=uncultured Pleomorphomonas sp. TaxID=442121 RepID=A0A212L6V8_9HYPH|nr:hypothetical protein [uncultured Pleomorphomonas sp.]SCM73312.1 conserved hypothetical protein [uncultured Pleomorphomonas sp.]
MTRPVGKHLTHEEHAEIRRRLAAGEQPSRIASAVGCRVQSVWKIRRAILAGSAIAAQPVPPERPEEVPPADPVEVARLKTQMKALQGENKTLLDRARKAEDLRAGLFGLTETPPEPVAFRTPEGGNPSAETIVLFLSDLHWGERVSIEAMDGLNSYSLDIARARIGRYFQTVADLATKHWTGPPPARLILILGGDLVSGEIHAELAKTNEAKALPAVKDCASHLAEGIALLRRRLPCPIDIVSLAGNHGRSTLKPESKEAVETSYDTLVSDFLEMALRQRRDVSFYVPSSVDALFPVYGFRLLATHGDRIGSRGGQGFIGPAATAARGMKRIVADYSARSVHLDLILMGHFHTAMQLEEGFVNGCLPGPSEYSRDGRFRPAPARQLWLTIHPRRGVTTTRWINVGVPSEGALYAPPPPDRELRPRWRVPAVSVPAE